MKTILISDIDGKHESIIPYALNFTKYINDEISIIHMVDPMIHQAVTSAFADSQSFQVGDKLSHAEILEREKHVASKALNTLLSREASKLNFPLRVKTTIEEKSLEALLKTEIGTHSPFLIICSSNFKNTALNSFSEFFELANSFGGLWLIVPPGLTFSKPEDILIEPDAKSGFTKELFDVVNLLNPFEPMLNIIDLEKTKTGTDVSGKTTDWRQQTVENESLLSKLKTVTLEGEQYKEDILSHIDKINIPLLAVPKKSGIFTVPGNYLKLGSKHWVKELNTPLLLY